MHCSIAIFEFRPHRVLYNVAAFTLSLVSILAGRTEGGPVFHFEKTFYAEHVAPTATMETGIRAQAWGGEGAVTSDTASIVVGPPAVARTYLHANPVSKRDGSLPVEQQAWAHSRSPPITSPGAALLRNPRKRRGQIGRR